MSLQAKGSSSKFLVALTIATGLVGVLAVIASRNLNCKHDDNEDDEAEISSQKASDTNIRLIDQRIYDCVIVGAGLSGLSTAGRLVNDHSVSRRDILVLEAQSYVGGRVKQSSDFIKGLNIDVGAELLHGSDTILNQIANENQLHTKACYIWAHGDDGPMEHSVQGGYGLYFVKKRKEDGSIQKQLLRYDTKDNLFVKTNELLAELVEVQDGGDNPKLDPKLSFYDWLEQKGLSHDSGMMGMVEAGYSNTLCSNSHDMSLKGIVQWKKSWEEEDGGDADFRLVHSYKGIIQYLLAQIGINYPVYSNNGGRSMRPFSSADENVTLLTSHCVDSIDYRGGKPGTDSLIKLKVRGKAVPGADDKKLYAGSSYDSRYCSSNLDGDEDWGESQEVLCRTVVVTAPLKVLNAGRIQFEPSLTPGQNEALNSRNVHTAMKIILKFRRRVWPEGVAGMIMAGSGNGEPRGGFVRPRDPADICFVPEVWFNDFTSHPRYLDGNVEDEATCYCTAFLTANYATEMITESELLAQKRGGGMTAHDAMCSILLDQIEEVFGELQPEHMLPEGEVTEEGTVVKTADGRKDGYFTARSHLERLISSLGKAKEEYLGGMVYVWDDASHPFIGGGYSSPRVGAFEHSSQQRMSSATEPSSERGLFFAGEGSSRGPGATAHSAIDSGQVAASHCSAFLKTTR